MVWNEVGVKKKFDEFLIPTDIATIGMFGGGKNKQKVETHTAKEHY